MAESLGPATPGRGPPTVIADVPSPLSYMIYSRPFTEYGDQEIRTLLIDLGHPVMNCVAAWTPASRRTTSSSCSSSSTSATSTAISIRRSSSRLSTPRRAWPGVTSSISTLRDRVVGFEHWKCTAYGEQAIDMLVTFGDELDESWLIPGVGMRGRTRCPGGVEGSSGISSAGR